MRILLLALFISLIVLVMTLSIYFYYVTPLSEFQYPATALVTEDTAGFDVNTTAITFGSIIVGGSSTRSIMVNNSYSFPIKVDPKINGNIREIIGYSPLIIKPYESAKFYFSVSANSSELLGNYSGDIIIRLMRA